MIPYIDGSAFWRHVGRWSLPQELQDAVDAVDEGYQRPSFVKAAATDMSHGDGSRMQVTFEVTWKRKRCKDVCKMVLGCESSCLQTSPLVCFFPSSSSWLEVRFSLIMMRHLMAKRVIDINFTDLV